jgi:rhodanese-related sulfurtransferase
MTNSITTPSLKQLLLSPFVPKLLDVRRKNDYVASSKKISSAVWRDPELINEWSTELSIGRKIVVYCVKGGSVSQSVAERLAREGHDVAFLEGGIKAWVDSGEPVE